MKHHFVLKRKQTEAINILGILIFLIFSCFSFTKADAAKTNTPIVGIAAIVNNEIISTRDLNNRIRLVTIISKIEVGAGNRNRLQKQILNQLIDEELENQEIARMQISITDREVDSAKSIMEKRFNVPKGELDNFIAINKIDKADAIAQIKTSLGWTRAVQQRFSAQLKISDSEVESIIRKIKKNVGRPEFNVSEILISNSENNDDNRTKDLAYRIYRDLRNGANFRQIARQFSGAVSSANGGRMGWVASKQLSANLDQPLNSLEIGDTTEPIKNTNGYYILRLDGKRTLMEFDPLKIKVTLMQMLLPLNNYVIPKTDGKLRPKIQNSLKKIKNCAAFKQLSTNLPNSIIRELGDFYVGELSKKLRALVKDLIVGTPAKPVKTGNELSIMNVCKRISPPSNIPSSETMRRKLLGEKLENLARKYLYELRRDAFIEIKI